eukprot:2489191-Pleurochrysis_carterae.AAC.1
MDARRILLSLQRCIYSRPYVLRVNHAAPRHYTASCYFKHDTPSAHALRRHGVHACTGNTAKLPAASVRGALQSSPPLRRGAGARCGHRGGRHSLRAASARRSRRCAQLGAPCKLDGTRPRRLREQKEAARQVGARV